MDLAPGETVLFRAHPSWRSILGFYLKGLLAAAVVGAVLGVLWDTGGAILIGFLLLAAVLFVGFLKRIGTHYVITERRLHIRHGILAKRTQETRLDRVQNVNTHQSVLERLLQVGTVDFDTAGTEDADFRFAGIAEPGDVVRVVDEAQREAAAAPGASGG